MNNQLHIASKLIKDASAILITSGAGMSQDSGIPTYRGLGSMSYGLTDPRFSSFIPDSEKGSWELRGYYGSDANVYRQVMSPQAYSNDPDIAWGFAGARLKDMRDIIPHGGYSSLLSLLNKLNKDYFIFTTNVDGHFIKSGFKNSNIIERHGSLDYFQCLYDCQALWKSEMFTPELSGINQPLLINDPPACPACHKMARPNVFMFSDGNWNKTRYISQRDKYTEWRSQQSSLLVIELGAGLGLPTARNESDDTESQIIRVNIDVKSNDILQGTNILNIKSTCHDFLTSLKF